MNYLQIPALAVLLLLTSIPLGLAQTDTYEKKVIVANGRGIVDAKPNKAVISMSVMTTKPTATEAVTSNAELTTAVINKMKEALGEDDKIYTSGYNLSPVHEYNKVSQESELKGYRVTNRVTIETKDLKGVGGLIDAAVNSGANNVDGIYFDTDKRSEYKKEALEKAVKDARSTADIVAAANGATITNVLRITPHYDSPQPMYGHVVRSQSMDYAEAAPTPIEPGDIKLSANVNIVYEIE